MPDPRQALDEAAAYLDNVATGAAEQRDCQAALAAGAASLAASLRALDTNGDGDGHTQPPGGGLPPRPWRVAQRGKGSVKILDAAGADVLLSPQVKRLIVERVNAGERQA